jgi:hypothetical protein
MFILKYFVGLCWLTNYQIMKKITIIPVLLLLSINMSFDGHITEWGAGRSEYARGTKIYPRPLLNEFPHDGWCDLPFSNMISGDEPVIRKHLVEFKKDGVMPNLKKPEEK